jgi:hypothetical protein
MKPKHEKVEKVPWGSYQQERHTPLERRDEEE